VDARLVVATVATIDPLTVVLPPGATPVLAQNFAGPLAVGDAVQVARVGAHTSVIARAGGTSAVSNRNFVINGRGQINQRGYVSGSTVAAGGFGLDRWSHAHNAQTWVSFTAAPQGQVMTLGYNAPATYGLIRQTFERADFVPDYYTVSWKGTAGARFANASVIEYAAIGVSPLTVYIDGAENPVLELITNGGPSTFYDVKVERGTVATPYVQESYADELRAAKRFYQVIDVPAGQYLAAGAYWSASDFVAPVPIPVTMRAAPTVAFSPAANFDVLATNSNRAVATIAATTSDKDVIGVAVTTASSGLSGAAGVLRGTNSSPGVVGHIYLNAEL